MRMRRKGSIMDIFFIIVIVFAFAITSVLGYLILSKFNQQVSSAGQISAQGQQISSGLQAKYVKIFDGAFAIILVLSVIITLFLASMVDANPIFLPISIILYIFIVIICAILANSFYAFASNAEVTAYSQDFVVIPFVINHLVEVMLTFAFGVGVVLYAKSQ